MIFDAIDICLKTIAFGTMAVVLAYMIYTAPLAIIPLMLLIPLIYVWVVLVVGD